MQQKDLPYQPEKESDRLIFHLKIEKQLKKQKPKFLMKYFIEKLYSENL